MKSLTLNILGDDMHKILFIVCCSDDELPRSEAHRIIREWGYAWVYDLFFHMQTTSCRSSSESEYSDDEQRHRQWLRDNAPREKKHSKVGILSTIYPQSISR